MEVTEQTSTRIVLKSPISKNSVWSGFLTILIAYIFLANPQSAASGGNYFWNTFVPIALILYGLFCIITLRTSILSIDKVEGTITRTNSYLFGMIRPAKSLTLANVSQFSIRHIRPYKLYPAAIWFMFHGNEANLNFKSARLHFGEGINKYEPANSAEEGVGQLISEFIGLPVTVNDRMIDSKNINTRMLAATLVMVTGAVSALAGLWLYSHFIKNT